MRLVPALAALLLAAASTAASAADDVMAFPAACRLAAKPMAGMAHGAPPQAAAQGHAGHGPALKDHQRAAEPGMVTMNRDMADGMMQDDADVAFTCGMIAHHQGAIAMSEVQLKYGKDPAMRAMAEAIVKAQKQEIAEMKSWLAARAKQ